MNRILVIDDKIDNCVSIKALLNVFIADCEVITALSGREGISLAASRKPDAILLDIHMPEMDGFEVCRVLKNTPGTAHIPVVILTAVRTSSQHRVKALNLGAEAFLTKPIDESELAAQIKAMLRIKKAEDILREEKGLLRDQLRDRINELEVVNARLRVEVQERRKAEETLKESENRFQKVFNSQLDAIFVLNDNKPPRIVDCNSAASVVFGYGREDLLGTNLSRLFSDGRQKQKFLDRFLPAVEAQGFLKDLQVSLKKMDGGAFPAELTVLEMRNDRYDRTGWIAIARDLTERKRMELSLQQAQKMESMGTLAGGIAHDFNNILSPLIGFTEILKEDLPRDSPEQEMIAEVLQAALRAKELVRQILTFSRQDQQEFHPVHVQSVLKEVIKLLKASIPKTIAIKSRISEACGQVKADPTEIHQIVMNLATNAYHAMQDTGGILEISLSQVEINDHRVQDLPGGEYARLLLRDSGCGIEPAIMDRLFDPYFTTKETGKGTGLGLSVVRGIVHRCRGTIRISSELGQGTEVEVLLPITVTADAQKGTEKDIPLPGGRERILLVDDEVSVSRIQAQLLERLGYRVTVSTSSAEALAVLTADPHAFDLLVTDMTMPQLTGEKLAEKAMTLRPSLPVILCTGYSERITMEKVQAMGIAGFLMKPVSHADMAETVREVLDRGRQFLA